MDVQIEPFMEKNPLKVCRKQKKESKKERGRMIDSIWKLPLKVIFFGGIPIKPDHFHRQDEPCKNVTWNITAFIERCFYILIKKSCWKIESEKKNHCSCKSGIEMKPSSSQEVSLIEAVRNTPKKENFDERV